MGKFKKSKFSMIHKTAFLGSNRFSKSISVLIKTEYISINHSWNFLWSLLKPRKFCKTIFPALSLRHFMFMAPTFWILIPPSTLRLPLKVLISFSTPTCLRRSSLKYFPRNYKNYSHFTDFIITALNNSSALQQEGRTEKFKR